MAFDFTEEDFSPRSKFDFSEEDFKPATPAVKRNVFGESKEDLEAKGAILRNEAISNKVGDVALNAASWAAYLTPGREQLARMIGLSQGVQERPALVDPETFKQTIQPLTEHLNMPYLEPVTQGATEFAAETASGLTKPSALETMATGPAAPLIFATEMAQQSPQALQQLKEAASTGDVKETTKAALNAGLAIAGPLGIAKAYERSSPSDKLLQTSPESATTPRWQRPLEEPTAKTAEPTLINQPGTVSQEKYVGEPSVENAPLKPQGQGLRQDLPISTEGQQSYSISQGLEQSTKELLSTLRTIGSKKNLSSDFVKQLESDLTGSASEGTGGRGVQALTELVRKGVTPKEILNSFAGLITEPRGMTSGKLWSNLQEQLSKEKEQYARINREAEALHGDVLPQPVEGEGKVPVKEGEPRVQPQTEGRVQEKEVAPAQTLETAIRDPNVKANNQHSTEAGMAVKSVEDLDKLAQLREQLYKESRDILAKSKEEKDPAKRDALFNEALILGNKVQLPREAIEVATNAGSWEEKPGQRELGERPLDWRNNPEVADWLDKNAKRIGTAFERPKTEPAKAPATAERPTGKGLQLKQPSPAMGEAGFIDLSSLNDFFDKTSGAVKSAFNFAKEVGKEVTSPERMTDYRRSVLNWSAKLQRAFGEAARIQSDIEKQVKDPIKRDAITNWIQAGGDPVKLRQQASASKDPKLAKGYEAALTLTPDELKIANDVQQRYAALERRGQRYDVLGSHKDNYVTQIWDLGKGPTGSAMGRTLKQKFRFSKARTFPSFFAGEQADFVPKTKDISKLLPVYLHEMESVIAARELVEEMSKGKASDGRPLVAAKGVGIPTENPGGDKATLVFPKIPTEETKDYKVLQNQPALENWKWTAKDDAGNNIFLKADLALHPEAYNKLKNVLGKSAIKEWYQTPTSKVMAIPKALVHGIDAGVSEVKKTMLGVLSPFHQVQEATHAGGHRVNPAFNIPEIDLVRNRDQMDAAQHGLMLQPDRASESQFMEGFKQSKLISKIPALGPASDWYSNYLFHQYIPGLKFKTYQSILERNNKVYAKDLAAGRVAPEDIKVLSAEQANAAFGHLNYADLGRNPTIQHIAQLGILAPDFFESRIRFAGQALKGATGLKVGREQVLALATLALGQAALAYTAAQLTGGQWDWKRPFEMTKNGKRYTIRSVPEDIQKFMESPRQFLHNRLSILGKGALQYSSGVNYKGQKVTAGETTKELAQQPIPLAARGFLGIGELSGMDQLAGAVGLKVGKASPRQDVMDRAHDWGINSTNPKIKAEYERRQKESLPDSVYKPLRQSLESGDTGKIVKNVKDILSLEPDTAAKEKRMKQILKEFQPFTAKDIKPFATRSKENEVKFLRSLDAAGKAAYRQAIKEQVEQYRALTKAIYGKPRNPPMPEQYQQTYGK